MKRHSLLLVLAFVSFTALFTSCKKSQEEKEPEEKTNSNLSSKDPQALSAAVKVWHGERLQGNTPAPKGTALRLDASQSAPVTPAFSGRFAIIQPAVAQGDVAGYYLQFTNAKEHFKIDYSKPRGGRTRPGKASAPAFDLAPRQQRSQNGNADSAIVIALPANLQVPDTFCVSYCAYDGAGNVSNVITTCIVVNSLGADAAGTWLNGTWKNTANWDSSFQNRDTVIYNKWTAARYSWGYVCTFDSFANKYVLTYNYNGAAPLVNDSVYNLKSHVTFGTNGGFISEYHVRSKEVNIGASTCSLISFLPVFDDQYTTNGGWNYNSATGKMIAIFEFDDNGTPELEAWEYKVMKINNNHIVLLDDSDPYHPYHARFER